MDKANAMRLSMGRNLFPQQTMPVHIQRTIWKTMNGCQLCHSVSGLRRMYMATASFPRTELMEDADSNQAQALRYPVKKPAARPYLPPTTEDQW